MSVIMTTVVCGTAGVGGVLALVARTHREQERYLADLRGGTPPTTGLGRALQDRNDNPDQPDQGDQGDRGSLGRGDQAGRPWVVLPVVRDRSVLQDLPGPAPCPGRTHP
jgi:hypothetical protein